MTRSGDKWTLEFTTDAREDIQSLPDHERERVLEKLDEIIESPWRDPPEYGEPLQNSDYKKVRIGGFRLSVAFRRDTRRMIIARVKRRGGAYTADD